MKKLLDLLARGGKVNIEQFWLIVSCIAYVQEHGDRELYTKAFGEVNAKYLWEELGE